MFGWTCCICVLAGLLLAPLIEWNALFTGMLLVCLRLLFGDLFWLFIVWCIGLVGLVVAAARFAVYFVLVFMVA